MICYRPIALFLLLVLSFATFGPAGAQALKPGSKDFKPPEISKAEVDELTKGLLGQIEHPGQKDALKKFLDGASLQTKRQFLQGKLMVPYDDKPAVTPFPRNISVVAQQTPIGGLSCKRKICHRSKCVNVPGVDVNVCWQNSYDCTDYTSGNC